MTWQLCCLQFQVSKILLHLRINFFFSTFFVPLLLQILNRLLGSDFAVSDEELTNWVTWKKTLICPDMRECFTYFELSSSASFIARCSAGSGCPVVVLALPLPSFYLGGSYSPGYIVHTAGLTQEQTHGLLLITELNPLAETQLFFVKTAQLLLSYKLLTWKSLLSPRPSYMTERARLLTAPFQFCLYRSQSPEVKLYYTHTPSHSQLSYLARPSDISRT